MPWESSAKISLFLNNSSKYTSHKMGQTLIMGCGASCWVRLMQRRAESGFETYQLPLFLGGCSQFRRAVSAAVTPMNYMSWFPARSIVAASDTCRKHKWLQAGLHTITLGAQTLIWADNVICGRAGCRRPLGEVKKWSTGPYQCWSTIVCFLQY